MKSKSTNERDSNRLNWAGLLHAGCHSSSTPYYRFTDVIKR